MKASKVNMIPMKTVKPAPANQGSFQIDSRTKIEIPLHVTDIEAWKQKMIDKFTGYQRRNELARLTGASSFIE